MSKRIRTFAIALAALGVSLGLLAGTAIAKDRNNDRIPDRWEKRHDLSLKVKQTRRDQDSDGLKNLGEYRSHTDPLEDDSDGDGIEDGDEDRDRDDVDNGNEQREHTRQNDRDSDDDGKVDGREDADSDSLDNKGEDVSGNDPVDRDTDDDGVEDGDENAGVVDTFDGTTLTVDLYRGGSLTGTVTNATEISCETEDEHENEAESEDSDSGDDSSSISSSSDSEDDSGKSEDGNEIDDADEVGDDDNVCTTADLTTGTIVHEAEIEHGVFEEIELVK